MLDLGCLGVLLSFQLFNIFLESLFNNFPFIFYDLPNGNFFVTSLSLSFKLPNLSTHKFLNLILRALDAILHIPVIVWWHDHPLIFRQKVNLPPVVNSLPIWIRILLFLLLMLRGNELKFLVWVAKSEDVIVLKSLSAIRGQLLIV